MVLPLQLQVQWDPSESAVLDNFVKSLFGPTVAVADSFWNRRIQEVTRDAQRPNTASPRSAWHFYLPQPSMAACTALFRIRKKPGAFSLHRDLPGVGVYDCTTSGAWGQTSWFLLANSLFPPHKTSKTASGFIWWPCAGSACGTSLSPNQFPCHNKTVPCSVGDIRRNQVAGFSR